MTLSPEDREAILSLPHNVRTLEPGSYLLRDGDLATTCSVILSGFACRHKVVIDGARQILAIHMKGDGIDFQNALLGHADHNIQAITRLEVAAIPASAINDFLLAHPAAGRAILTEVLTDASIQREWTANVGRRDARTRLCHLLCEIGLRQEAAGIGARDRFELPLTQEQLADATGLTAVHVNRVLQGLRAERVIASEKRVVNVSSWDELTRIGDFRSAYLQQGGRNGA